MGIESIIASHIAPASHGIASSAHLDHTPVGGDKDPSFASMLDRSITDVNKLIQESDKKQTDVAVGKSENLHDAMISFEKADVALKLLVQVRNKAIEAYHEIMRMQV